MERPAILDMAATLKFLEIDYALKYFMPQLSYEQGLTYQADFSWLQTGNKFCHRHT